MKRTAGMVLALAAAAAVGSSQELWAPKGTAAKYIPPHKPHTQLAGLRAKYAGKTEWRELVVDDEHLRSEYIQLKPGARTPRQLHPDTRVWWVVLSGQVKFDIETVEPFVAGKGSMVQAPMQTLYSMEVAGSEPAVIFETNIAGAKTLYVNQADAPRMPAFDFIPVKFQRKAGVFGRNNKAHMTFAEAAEALETGKAKGFTRVVEDDRGTANFIYGYEKTLPPLDLKNRGHYHPEGAEYWLILAGQIRYPVEKVGVIIANEGDVVYVPKFTFHAPRWWGPGPSCRLAMNGYPNIAHLFE